MSKLDALTKKLQSLAEGLKSAVEQIQEECNRQDERITGVETLLKQQDEMITDLEARIEWLEESNRN